MRNHRPFAHRSAGPLAIRAFGGYPPQQAAEGDSYYYATLASAMLELGIETPGGSRAELLASFADAVPYHYLDLWTAAFLEQASGFSAISVLSFQVYPFLVSLLAFGVFTQSKRILLRYPTGLALLAGLVAPATAGFALNSRI